MSRLRRDNAISFIFRTVALNHFRILQIWRRCSASRIVLCDHLYKQTSDSIYDDHVASPISPARVKPAS